MTPLQAIDQAKETLIYDRDLNAILNRTGSVRVPVMPDLSAMQPTFSEPPSASGCLVVTFTIEDGHFGRRLMAEYNGHKEFAA